jgi:hypothetical protein
MDRPEKFAGASDRMHVTGQAAARRSRLTMQQSRLMVARGRKALASSAQMLRRSTPKTQAERLAAGLPMRAA